DRVAAELECSIVSLVAIAKQVGQVRSSLDEPGEELEVFEIQQNNGLRCARLQRLRSLAFYPVVDRFHECDVGGHDHRPDLARTGEVNVFDLSGACHQIGDTRTKLTDLLENEAIEIVHERLRCPRDAELPGEVSRPDLESNDSLAAVDDDVRGHLARPF